MNLTSSQWALLEPLIDPKPSTPTRGRPKQDARAVLEGVLWIIQTGAHWADLPPRFPPYQTCHRHFRNWLRSGVLVECLRRLAEDLKQHETQAATRPEELARQLSAPRTWQWNTTLLLQSPLGRAVLSQAAVNQIR
jgi:transposase